MDSVSLSGKVLRFGPFELDLETQQLRRSGKLIRVQPQPLKVLTVLVSRGGQIVSREELRQELWGKETFVDFEQGLNYCVRQIRTVLADEAQTPRYIETIPRRGYRFIAPVEGLESPPADSKEKALAARKRLRRRAVFALASLALFVALATATSYFIQVRASRRFVERDTVVLAEFTNNTGDAEFDDVLSQALAIELEQSPFLNILSTDRVNRTLKMMNRAGERLHPDVAREVCVRTNSKAMLAGTISIVGSHYLLALRALNCQSGDTLASAEGEAENRDKILYALQKAGNQLRQGLGESLASVSRYNKPLPEATTSSLEALKAYSMTIATSRPEALVYLLKAVELDPNFALAWAGLGARYNNFGQHALARASYTRAFELRDRVSERERYYIEAHYYEGVTGELPKAVQVYQQWIQAYPEDFTPYGNLGYEYANMGFYDMAASATREAVRLSPDFVTFNGNLEGDYVALNRLEDARALYQQAQARGLDGVVLHSARYYVGFLQGDAPAMQQQVAWASGKPGAEDWLLSAESDTAAYFGQLSKAHDFSQRAADSAKRNAARETAALWEMNEALRLAEFGYSSRARETASAALNLASEPDVKLMAALVFARSHDGAQARKLADGLDREFPSNTLMQAYWLPTIRASLERDRLNFTRAIDLLLPTKTYELASSEVFQVGTMYPVYVRGLVYLQAGQANEAAAEFQRILDHRSVIVNFPLASLSLLQLARAKAMSQDSDGARKAYKDFLVLWKDADPDVPVLRQARGEYAALQ